MQASVFRALDSIGGSRQRRRGFVPEALVRRRRRRPAQTGRQMLLRRQTGSPRLSFHQNGHGLRFRQARYTREIQKKRQVVDQRRRRRNFRDFHGSLCCQVTDVVGTLNSAKKMKIKEEIKVKKEKRKKKRWEKRRRYSKG